MAPRLAARGRMNAMKTFCRLRIWGLERPTASWMSSSAVVLSSTTSVTQRTIPWMRRWFHPRGRGRKWWNQAARDAARGGTDGAGDAAELHGGCQALLGAAATACGAQCLTELPPTTHPGRSG